MEGFVTQAIGSKVHGDENLGPQILKRLHRLLGIEMIFAEFGPVVSPDRQESDFRSQLLSDFLESLKIARVSRVVDGPVPHIDDIPAVSPMVIRDLACSPVFGGNKGDGRRGETKPFPPIHFVDFFETNAMNKIPNARGNHNRLVGGNPTEASAVQVIKMSVGDQNQINVGQMMMGETGMTETTHDQQPVGPVRIDENVSMRSLDQKGGVADPGDGNLPLAKFGKNRGGAGAVPTFAGEKSWKKNIGDEAVGTWPFSGMGRT